jgi:UDP-glucose-4-epimerase GalE
MLVAVTGGAGYIGSHAVCRLARAGHQPVIFDNLSTGHAEVAERLGVPMVVGDLTRADDLDRLFSAQRFDAVMHFAAACYVGESVREPGKYYRNNVTGTLHLLLAMRRHKLDRIIFSSSCATYGMPQTSTLDEQHPQNPISPYGWSKRMAEQMLLDFAAAYGLRHVSLRYFNAAGASPDGVIGEDHDPETHLIPLCLLTAAGQRDRLVVFGTDYPTPDGTCVRDYIHVDDLAEAHVQALGYLNEGSPSLALNVGTGRGYSVREVIQCAQEITGRSIRVEHGPRRPGDPPRLVAAAEQIRVVLGWQPEYATLEPIIETAWNWIRRGGRFSHVSR